MLAGELSSGQGKQTIVLMTPIMSREMLGAFVIMCAKINIWVRDRWRFQSLLSLLPVLGVTRVDVWAGAAGQTQPWGLRE